MAHSDSSDIYFSQDLLSSNNTVITAKNAVSLLAEAVGQLQGKGCEYSCETRWELQVVEEKDEEKWGANFICYP